MEINLGGIVPLSTLDWTGISAAVIFMRGCPLRCPHCHNAHLQSGETLEDIEKIKKKIDEAGPFISGVILSGGEPLVQLAACRAVAGHAKVLGLLVGVETCGYFPDRLAEIIEEGLVDMVFLDVKEALKDPEYERATGRKGVAPRVAESLRLCMEAKVPLEVRTTVFPNMPSIDGLLEIAELLRDLAVGSMTLQQGRPSEGEKPFDSVPIKLLTIAAQTMKERRGIDATVKKGPLPSRSRPYQTELFQICQLRKPHPVMRKDPKIEDQDHKTGDQS
ncbi:anaerobic ribonucleoside-triphosphate reductase activating protein [Methanotrichaceae archaeon M04Ac]|uniref:Anaerobic ribonucleoside-triphosphate reductase activating protein n=1 Tax=Candidatus Methanocrinis alkalitolerans TaxID=3033395 RepID=A0ABT5XHX9_9EURY|nr:anaerobic ribonucleoside-triphosphate reductase activating protein [Candidatus Methanocrinis alkalitolerans]MDF0594280.1 anaerobic ribonucleoside-triphosphate reductase activating protein [Candidatus Methanocrinis alkalitolerans]